MSAHLIAEGEIREHLPSGRIEWTVHAFGTVASTNEVAQRLAAAGAPEGSLVIAATQTRGRGRRGNRWESPPGGLWFSLVLRPHLPPEEASGLSVVAAVAVARAARDVARVDARIKWPNDVHVGGRKLGGVMVESAGEEALVLGVGVNVNIPPDELPEARWYETTSLLAETGRRIALAAFLGRVLGRLETGYFRYRGPDRGELVREWRELSLVLGEQVVVGRGGEVIEGTVFGLEDDGSLVVRLADGRHERVLPIGDVTLEVVA